MMNSNSMNEIYNKKISVLNKLKGSDSPSNIDSYFKTILDGCGWNTKKVSSVSGSTVSIGEVIRIMIPFKDNYLPYSEWKADGKQAGNFTLSLNDTIILGEVLEDVTPKTITTIKKQYAPDVCEIRHIQVAEDKYGKMCELYIQLLVEGV